METALVYVLLEDSGLGRRGDVISNVPNVSVKHVETNSDPQRVVDDVVGFLKAKYDGRVYRRYTITYDPSRVGRHVRIVEVGITTPSFVPISAFRNDVEKLMRYLFDKYVLHRGIPREKPVREHRPVISKPIPVKITRVAYSQGSPEARRLEERVLHRKRQEAEIKVEKREEREDKKKGLGILALILGLLNIK